MNHDDDPDAAADLFLDLYMAAGNDPNEDEFAFWRAITRRIERNRREATLLKRIHNWEIARLYAKGKGVPGKKIARATNKSVSWVSMHAAAGDSDDLTKSLRNSERRLRLVASDIALPETVREAAARRARSIASAIGRFATRLTGAAGILGPSWLITQTIGGPQIPGLDHGASLVSGGGFSVGTLTFTSGGTSAVSSTAGPLATTVCKTAAALVTGVQAAVGVSTPVATAMVAGGVAITAVPVVQGVEEQLVHLGDVDSDEVPVVAIGWPSPSPSATDPTPLSTGERAGDPSPIPAVETLPSATPAVHAHSADREPVPTAAAKPTPTEPADPIPEPSVTPLVIEPSPQPTTTIEPTIEPTPTDPPPAEPSSTTTPDPTEPPAQSTPEPTPTCKQTPTTEADSTNPSAGCAASDPQPPAPSDTSASVPVAAEAVQDPPADPEGQALYEVPPATIPEDDQQLIGTTSTTGP